MHSAAPHITVNMFKVRNFVFLTAVMMMHYTLLRPTPADVMFMLALALSFTINQRINFNLIIFALILLVWTLCFYVASIHVMNDPDVRFQLLAHTFVVLVGLGSCLMALGWDAGNYRRFMKVYLASCCVTALMGVIGFGTGFEAFLWDGRAKGLFDEPNMFGAFLLPGVLIAMHLLNQRDGFWFPLAGLLLCVLGVVLSFSRAAVFSLILIAPVYFVFISRRHMAKAIVSLLILVTAVTVVTGIAFFTVENFQEKVADRLTFAKDYDAAEGGRYDRYIKSIPLILDNPLGLGMLEINKIFPEPIHNIFLSSFLNYGWLAGLAWTLLLVLTIRISFYDYRATQNPLSALLSFSLLTQMPSAFLHQVEHWRHLWMLLGLMWGLNIRNFITRPDPATRAETLGGTPHPQPRYQ